MADAQLDRFRRRTWHHTDFDPAALAARRDLSVSVVIPALDEASTVGAVVGVAAGLHGLVDEVVVVDGGSRDGTVEVAQAAGARVVHQHGALGEHGPGRGKGDALWKGLAVTTGDLVVFLDADLHDADDRYVVGLLGPLLTDADVGYVKACYDRPFRLGDERADAGGGRVTELTARPLLAAFWPELAFLAQPLSGEYAGRRALLERVPFVEGYGVEIGLLLDIVATAGADAIGQVDLGRRVHRHQPLSALSRMAFEILLVATERLADEGRLTDEVATTLLQPARTDDGALTLDPTPGRVSRRPPLRALGQRPGSAA